MSETAKKKEPNELWRISHDYYVAALALDDLYSCVGKAQKQKGYHTGARLQVLHPKVPVSQHTALNITKINVKKAQFKGFLGMKKLLLHFSLLHSSDHRIIAGS